MSVETTNISGMVTHKQSGLLTMKAINRSGGREIDLLTFTTNSKM